MNNRNAYTTTVTYEQAKKLCARLEYDASYDKVGEVYYELKRFIAAVDFVEGDGNE